MTMTVVSSPSVQPSMIGVPDSLGEAGEPAGPPQQELLGDRTAEDRERQVGLRRDALDHDRAAVGQA